MKRLYVVGIGPGSYDKMTLEAKEILDRCEVIAGYTVYVDLVKEMYREEREKSNSQGEAIEKEYIITGMTQETERCIRALEEADKGRLTAVVCSGDSGVYGMAGVLMEMGEKYPEVVIQVAAGVTAALSGSAVLGAPVGHDFAAVSLSDWLTPWEKIEQRLRCAAMADFVICIYNPSGSRRKDYLQKACRVVREFQSPETVCGYVRNIGRSGEAYKIMSLRELENFQADMFTTVFIGNSQTRRIGDRMVTPRGYLLEKGYQCQVL